MQKPNESSKNKRLTLWHGSCCQGCEPALRRLTRDRTTMQTTDTTAPGGFQARQNGFARWLDRRPAESWAFLAVGLIVGALFL